MARTKTVPAAQLLEEIQSVTHYPDGRVDIVVGLGSMVDDLDKYNKVIGQVFRFAPDQQFECICVAGEDYDSLLSDAPAWNVNKKQGQFGMADAWTAIDAKRGGGALKDYSGQG